VRAFLTREPWSDTFELRLGYTAGKYGFYASGVDIDGQIIWAQRDESAQIPAFLKLRADVIEALAKELGMHVPAAEATVVHLKDALAIRDRLLTLVEEGWHA
jgi:hypothetical protein